MKKLLIGAHMSIEGGPSKAIERGSSIGCTVLQIFTKSNRQWATKPLSEKEIQDFKQAVKDTKITTVVAHASYLINLASPLETTRDKSIGALKKELERCDALEIKYLVLHPGSPVNQGKEKGIKLIAEGINKAFDGYSGSTMLLLETMARQGSSLGGTFEEIAEIRNACNYTKKIGVCFDTCHAFAAGYDFRTENEYKQMWALFEKIIGLSHLKVIHINDSKKELASRVDRHEHIGKGKLGQKAFELLFNDPRLFDIPKILETPKASLNDDKKNIQTIKNLLTEKTKKILKEE